jgi:hypothetical protein
MSNIKEEERKAGREKKLINKRNKTEIEVNKKTDTKRERQMSSKL